jgi:hypothetical protein
VKAIDRFERFGTPIHNGQDFLKNHIFEKYPVIHSDLDISKYYGKTDYVWVVDDSITTYDSFPWYFKPQADEAPSIHAFPYVYKKSRKVKSWDKVRLVPTVPGEYPIRQHAYICSEYDVYKSKDKFDIFYIGNDKTAYNAVKDRIKNIQVVDTFKQAQSQSYTDMFWVIYDDTIVRDTFKFSYEPDEWSHDFVHVFGNGNIDRLDGIALFPKNYQITERELTHRFYANKKEVRIMASNPKPYDRFEINSYEQYLNALNTSTTNMFWGIPQDVTVVDEFNLQFTIAQGSSELNSNHVWLNGTKYDGVVLYSKESFVAKKEIEFRFLANRIEHPTVASNPRKFDRFVINNYQDYKDAKKQSETNMFWGIPSDVVATEDFKWDRYFDDMEALDRNITHVFLNSEHYDGIVLHSTAVELSEKEIEHKFFINKKEHNFVASNPVKYDIFTIDSYEDYTNALYESKSELFWSVPSDVIVADNFDFDMYFSHHNQYDRHMTHVFLNGEHRDGIVLFSKHVLVSEKEVEHRFYIKKKEWNIVASTPKPYDKFTISSYEDFERAKETSTTDMLWITNNDIIENDNFDWNFYISHHNQYERKINHVWKNGEYYDGISLVSKNVSISKREIDYRFFAIKKEYNTISSMPKPFDIVFISSNEPNADNNYKLLTDRYPNAKRVHGVKGIHQAHKAAAELVSTELFWVVDGDAQILDDFDFDYQVAHYDLDGKETVHVWRSFNPINSLVYGYGGVKLLPTQLTRDVDVNSTDMTTSISNKFKGIERMSNTTAFNTDDFSAWRSGFRECVKLSSRIIDRQKDEETEFRLNAWCERGADKPFGKAAIAGAIAGRAYGTVNKGNIDELKKINDFNWLHEQFKLSYQLDE